ncbi:hypothetical protein QBC38DRAFT_360328 [Podospora fimiseda]|uniref:Maf-like protein n=1 Tax=Podospora fimiseda TaxID=252190 RepID=A0AAN7BTD9_9PEZI|nr:hypothetical protein QBC38DRAFT_360328 [Podospora fimiseda]
MDDPSPPPAYITAAHSHGIPLRQTAPIKRGPPPLDIPILKYLRSKKIILASASPRRQHLLSQLSLYPTILPSSHPENLSQKDKTPEQYVSATAQEKCLSVYKTAIDSSEHDDPDLVIAADTIIATRSGKILEKPKSEQDHINMLKHLRDTVYHRVLTAVVVLAPKQDLSHPGYEMECHVEDTKVYFAGAEDGLPDDVIESYVKSREGADKAGGYAIQGVGGMVLVEKVEGSVDNVVGLPVRKCLQLCEQVVFRQGQEEDRGEDD